MATDDTAGLLAALRRYLPLDEAQTEELRRMARPARVPRGEHLFRPPEVCRRLFFMARGLVRSYYLFDDKEVNLRLICDGSAVLPLTSLIMQEPAQEHIQCLADAEGWWLSLDAMLRPESAPAWEPLRRVLAERHYLSMERRLLTIQYKSAAQRWEYFRRTMEPRIVAETPVMHIASYLGVTPESLSRIRRGPGAS
jgi:CRP-like cAMP-binding protein